MCWTTAWSTRQVLDCCFGRTTRIDAGCTMSMGDTGLNVGVFRLRVSSTDVSLLISCLRRQPVREVTGARHGAPQPLACSCHIPDCACATSYQCRCIFRRAPCISACGGWQRSNHCNFSHGLLISQYRLQFLAPATERALPPRRIARCCILRLETLPFRTMSRLEKHVHKPCPRGIVTAS